MNADTVVINWSNEKALEWAQDSENLSPYVIHCLRNEEIDGRTLLTLTENDIRDLRYKLNYPLKFSDIKKLWISVKTLQNANPTLLNCLGLNDAPALANPTQHYHHHAPHIGHASYHSGSQSMSLGSADILHLNDIERVSPPLSVDGRATNVPPELFKTFISIGYSFLVTWITSFVMVIVHERVPDMKRYPPLPDIFLDNVPHIPWAFNMCEITGTLLFSIWVCVCVFHKYRMVLLRRFFGIAGTVFLLRCVTMLITSLSVPGTHLQCSQNDYKVDDTNLTLSEAIELRISRAYIIWSGLGMSIQGVRTCGDYMFSGHTVALTLLNFFITEYTPRNLYFLHTLTWLLNMFGIFFILAAHEHYSIDVFVAFYITSRLFLYYHTLANNQALMSHDSNRTRIWFPMFSYFESSVDGIIPNEFDTIQILLSNIFSLVLCIKDSFMLTARRFWIVPPYLAPSSNNFLGQTTLSTSQSNESYTSTPSSSSSTIMASMSTLQQSNINMKNHLNETAQINSIPHDATLPKKIEINAVYKNIDDSFSLRQAGEESNKHSISNNKITRSSLSEKKDN